jgi:hypothetical protein
VEYLRQEQEFLKKFFDGKGREVEMIMKSSPSAKYEIVHEALDKDGVLMNFNFAPSKLKCASPFRAFFARKFQRRNQFSRRLLTKPFGRRLYSLPKANKVEPAAKVVGELKGFVKYRF